VQVGQSLEVELPFGHRWSLGPAAGQPALYLDMPAGYGDLSLKSCVWHFTAQQAGQVNLSFTSGPICQAHEECPQFLVVVMIAVEVRG